MSGPRHGRRAPAPERGVLGADYERPARIYTIQPGRRAEMPAPINAVRPVLAGSRRMITAHWDSPSTPASGRPRICLSKWPVGVLGVVKTVQGRCVMSSGVSRPVVVAHARADPACAARRLSRFRAVSEASPGCFGWLVRCHPVRYM